MTAILIVLKLPNNTQQIPREKREYGSRNYSELSMQRYQKTFGDTLHVREFSRQQQEAMIASGALNKMTSLGMPQRCRSV